ncbi:MAG: hemerythrin domain-containing protein [Rhizobiaceae bacterium]|nr:hemerythrin domain-containing protein [Rhizobiaceae bacterium]
MLGFRRTRELPVCGANGAGGPPPYKEAPPPFALPRPEARAAPLAAIRAAHGDKLRLCDALEQVADTLPGHVDRILCLQIANALVPLLRDVHRYEEEVIFPAYEAIRGATETTATSLRRLCAEHVEDECFADEVTQVLLSIGHGCAIDNPEAVGFMLRGLFETLRRHIAFEAEHILPAIAGPAHAS